MSHLIQERVARELVADRLRESEHRRLGRDARRHAKEAHGSEVERVRASLLLVPRAPFDGSREA